MKVRCQAHDRTFSESFDASFHESMNFNCVWEKVVEPMKEPREPIDRVWVAVGILFSWFALAIFLGFAH